MKNKWKKIYFKPDFYYDSALGFCLHLGIHAEDIAEMTDYSVATVKRWLKDDTAPPWLLPLLYASEGGILGKGFDGWRLTRGLVCAPGIRYPLTASQVESYTWHLDILHQAHSALEQQRHAQTARDQVTPSAQVIEFAKWKNENGR